MFPKQLYINMSQVKGFNDLVHNDNCESTNILKLNKMECRTSNNNKYKVIRYDKNFLSVDIIPTFGLCRSIIVNQDNKVVCFSPPKSLPADVFMKEFPDKSENIIAQEFVEGTMINLFYDSTIGLTGGWEIATRNTVGATSSFYKKDNKTKSFKDMFLEAVEKNNLFFEGLNKTFCYSFVLQHPENRIVVPFKTPQLYLVAIYSIANNVDITIASHDIYDVDNCGIFASTGIKFPQLYEWCKYSDLIEKYASMNTLYDILGVVIYNRDTGVRTKIRNPVYEEVRLLRGNQPKLQYQYLSLRNQGKVSDYLKFYPENKKEFSSFREQVHLFTNTIYNNYVSCYIKKEKPLIEFAEQYRTHMFNIHRLYLDELREKKQFVTNSVVIKYVNELAPTLLMYCLNFHMRKRNVDFIKLESEAEVEA